MEPDTNQLLRAARTGDHPAAVQLIELSYTRIYGFLLRLTANEADAADLTQRAFTRMWQALPGFAGRSSVLSWIHSIAYHLYVDWRRAERPDESRSPQWWAERASHEPRPDELAARADMATTLYASVDKLEPDLHHTIHLHYYQELTLQETADVMGVAASTVKYRLRLALKELQKHLAAERSALSSSTISKAI